MGDLTAARTVHLPPQQLEQVRAILRESVPGRQVWAFGSRATGRLLKRFSDLDLAVEGELTWEQRARLTEAFEESLLPIKVDVVELSVVTPAFRERIEPDFVRIQGAEAEFVG